MLFKELILSSIAITFLFAEVSTDKIEYICSTKGYKNKFENVEKCKEFFDKMNKLEATEKNIISSSKNTLDLYNNYVKNHKNEKIDLINYNMALASLPFRVSEEAKAYDFVLDKIEYIYKLGTLSEKDPFNIVKELPSGDLSIHSVKTPAEFNAYLRIFNSSAYRDKLRLSRIVLMINNLKKSKINGAINSSEVMIDTYIKLREKINKESFFKNKIFLNYSQAFSYFNKKEDILYVLPKLKKIIISEKNPILRMSYISSYGNLLYKINKDIVLEGFEKDTKVKSFTYMSDLNNYKKDFISLNDMLMVISLFNRNYRGLINE